MTALCRFPLLLIVAFNAGVFDLRGCTAYYWCGAQATTIKDAVCANAARERHGPLPSIKAGALLDERRVLTELGHETLTEIFTVPDVSKRDRV